uniref:Receptor-type protein tyrosine kinase n=1 Tax=Monosiga ovata TaxID=81526 RepID=B3XVV5_9EUKA|nr:receptor-type protein tyrosine kinase [Monosiga ovata]
MLRAVCALVVLAVSHALAGVAAVETAPSADHMQSSDLHPHNGVRPSGHEPRANVRARTCTAPRCASECGAYGAAGPDDVEGADLLVTECSPCAASATDTIAATLGSDIQTWTIATPSAISAGNDAPSNAIIGIVPPAPRAADECDMSVMSPVASHTAVAVADAHGTLLARAALVWFAAPNDPRRVRSCALVHVPGIGPTRIDAEMPRPPDQVWPQAQPHAVFQRGTVPPARAREAAIPITLIMPTGSSNNGVPAVRHSSAHRLARAADALDGCLVCTCVPAGGSSANINLLTGTYSRNATGIIAVCTGLHLQAMPSFPNTTSFIILDNNNITSLTPADIAPLPNLIGIQIYGNNGVALNITPGTFLGTNFFLLILVGCGLTDLSHGEFDGLTGVRFLQLDDNQLTSLTASMLAPMPGLLVFAVTHNTISHISANAFSTLTELAFVNLGRNNITSLSTGVFTNQGSLLQLFISSNNIAEIEPDVFPSNPLYLSTLVMDGNPSVCKYGMDTKFNQTLLCQCAPGYAGTTSCLPIASLIPYTPPQYVVANIPYEFPVPGPINASCRNTSAICQIVVNATTSRATLTCILISLSGFTVCPLYIIDSQVPWIVTIIATVFDPTPPPFSVSLVHSTGFAFEGNIPDIPITSAYPLNISYFLTPTLAVPGLKFNPTTAAITGKALTPTSGPKVYAVNVRDYFSHEVKFLGNYTLNILTCLPDETCNDNGACVPSANASQSRCACFSGYTGPACAQPDASSSGPSTGLLLAIILPVGLVALAACIIAIVALVRLYRRKRAPINWAALLAAFESEQDGRTARRPREIKRAAIQKIEDLGIGNFGIVMKALLQETTTLPAYLVAAKKSVSQSDQAKLLLKEEAAVMAQFHSPHVLQLIGVVTIGEPMLLVTEYAENGSLLEFLHTHELADLQRIRMFYECALGLGHIHAQGFIHRDVAARNILLGSDFTCKVSDFGHARHVRQIRESETDYYITHQECQLAVRWAAPEAMRDGRFSEFSDVWSLGVVAYEIWTFGELPYKGMTNRLMVVRVLDGFRLPQPPDCTAEMFAVIQQCWQADHHRRPTLASLATTLQRFDTETRRALGPEGITASFANLQVPSGQASARSVNSGGRVRYPQEGSAGMRTDGSAGFEDDANATSLENLNALMASGEMREDSGVQMTPLITSSIYNAAKEKAARDGETAVTAPAPAPHGARENPQASQSVPGSPHYQRLPSRLGPGTPPRKRSSDIQVSEC